MATAGVPATLAPLRTRSPNRSVTWYQMLGSCRLRCGSAARIEVPLADFRGPTTQLLLAEKDGSSRFHPAAAGTMGATPFSPRSSSVSAGVSSSVMGGKSSLSRAESTPAWMSWMMNFSESACVEASPT